MSVHQQVITGVITESDSPPGLVSTLQYVCDVNMPDGRVIRDVPFGRSLGVQYWPTICRPFAVGTQLYGAMVHGKATWHNVELPDFGECQQPLGATRSSTMGGLLSMVMTATPEEIAQVRKLLGVA
jgi:hypothetical protein